MGSGSATIVPSTIPVRRAARSARHAPSGDVGGRAGTPPSCTYPGVRTQTLAENAHRTRRVEPGHLGIDARVRHVDLREPVASGGGSLSAADDRIVVRIQAVELGVVHPGVLDELELTSDLGVEADEVQTARLLVGQPRGEERRGVHRLAHGRSVGPPTTDDPVALAAWFSGHIDASDLLLIGEHPPSHSPVPVLVQDIAQSGL